jgi:hypothetical protein
VKVIRQPVVPVVTVPEIITVPVEIDIIFALPYVVALIVKEPAESVPAPTANVKFVPVVVGLAIVIRPVTVKE